MSDISDVSDISDLSDLSDLPDPSDMSDLSDISDRPDLADLSDLSDLPDLSNLSDLSDLPDISDISDLYDLSDVCSNRVFAVCQRLLGWKTCTYYWRPTNFPTQKYIPGTQLKDGQNRTLNKKKLNFRALSCGLGVMMAFVGFHTLLYFELICFPAHSNPT